MGVQRGGQTATRRFHKFQFIFLNLAFHPLEAAAQEDHIGGGKTDQYFFWWGVWLLILCRIGKPLGRQELRVGQQVTVSIVGTHIESGDLGVTAKTRIITPRITTRSKC